MAPLSRSSKLGCDPGSGSKALALCQGEQITSLREGQTGRVRPGRVHPAAAGAVAAGDDPPQLSEDGQVAALP